MTIQPLPLFVDERELHLLAAPALAWALRQRDTERARQLLALLPAGARRWLTEAECLLLNAQVAEADALQQRALQAFAGQGDDIGLADVHWLAFQIGLERGDYPAQVVAQAAAVAAARRAGDAQRLLFMEAGTARGELLRDRNAAQARWAGVLPTHSDDPVCAAALLDFHGCLQAMCSNYPQATADFEAAFGLSLRTGQLRRAITLATNLGFAFTRMHDFESAIDWQRRALDLARAARWPRLICLCLAQTGEALRRLGEADEARAMLLECLQLHAADPGARTVALARKYLAHLDMDCGDPAAALAGFEQLGDSPAVRASRDLRIDADQGRARALLGLGRLDEATAAAQQALQAARHQQERGQSLELLGLLAEITLARGEPAQALAMYRQALDEAQGLAGYRPPPTLLDGCARAHAALGEYHQAFELARRAIALREHSHSEQARRHSRAMQVQHQVDRARTEAEHLRRLAASEAARSAALEDAHGVLQQLGSMGQELTAELRIERLLELLQHRVGAMVDAWHFAVFLLDEPGTQLDCVCATEDGRAVTRAPVARDDAHADVARCARERRELLLPPGRLLMPLTLGQQLVGVLSLESHRPGAYGERELLILRNLAAYAAIALANAHAYQRVSALQRQLMAQEKLAALGVMVAGVAHELNTPIGNSLLTATTLLVSNRELAGRLVEGRVLRKSELVMQTGVTVDGLELIERSMLTAANLVNNFKQMAQARGSHERLSFELASWCTLYLGPQRHRAEQAGHALDLDIAPQLLLDSYPAQLGQALDILIGNALVHGLAAGRPGRIGVRARALQGGRCRIEVSDDGRGMGEDVRQRVFEPFFSTRFGQGGNGLGLAICHVLVHEVLGGRIEAHSEPGRGSRFVIELPLSAP